MPTEDKLAKLLEKNIEASNRTTHAVRAFVRFLFIQLSFLTAAVVVEGLTVEVLEHGDFDRILVSRD